jgi:glycine cleavage system H lipoate-binding protein
LWVNEAAVKGEWIMGLDHHALLSFSMARTFSLPRPGRRITRGEELLSLIVGEEALRWPAPADVVILERNDRWSGEAASLRASPYRDTWVLLAKFPEPPLEDEWMDTAAMEAVHRAEGEALKELVLAGLKAAESTGPTAPDGGALIVPGDRILPLREYLAFLRIQWGLLPAER